MPKASIVMPVYNGSRYLASSIESVLSQTFQDFELIVINDGSTDRSMDILQGYSDKRIRIIDRKGNLGLPATRNEGVAAAKSPYIAMLDCDDIALPQRLEKQVCFLDDNHDVGVAGSYVLRVDENGSSTSDVWKFETTCEQIAPAMLFRNRFVQSAVIMRRDVLPSPAYREEFSTAEDYDLWVRLLQRTKMVNIPEPLVSYRVHSGATSRQCVKGVEENTKKVIVSQLENFGISPDEEQLRVHRFLGRGKGAEHMNTMTSASQWLGRLNELNHSTGYYASVEFHSVLAERWALFCQMSSQVGWRAFKSYWQSPYRKGDELSTVALAKFATKSFLGL